MSRRDRPGRGTNGADEDERPRPLLWGSNVSKAITSAGALAGAIIALVTAWKLVVPPSNPHDEVAIGKIQAIPQSLSDFRPGIQHEDAAGGGSATGSGAIVVTAGALKLFAQVTDEDGSSPADGAAVTTPPETTETSTPTTVPEQSDDGTATDPSTTSPPTGASTSGGSTSTATTVSPDTHSRDLPAERADAQLLTPKIPVILPDATDKAQFTDSATTIVATTQPLVPDINLRSCEVKINGVCVAVLFMLSTISVDPEGNAVPPDIAAKRVAKFLKRTRTVRRHGERVPQGLLVTTKIRLVALRHRDVSLAWSVLPVDGQGELGRGWRGPNLSYRLRADDDDDRVVVPLWIPLPKRKGRYIIRLDIFRGDTNLEQADSDPFR
jgi:hypothetical protein